MGKWLKKALDKAEKVVLGDTKDGTQSVTDALKRAAPKPKNDGKDGKK